MIFAIVQRVTHRPHGTKVRFRRMDQTSDPQVMTRRPRKQMGSTFIPDVGGSDRFGIHVGSRLMLANGRIEWIDS